MTPSWRDGLVNAFPTPPGRKKLKKSSTKNNYEIIFTPPVEEVETGPTATPFSFLELPGEIRNRIYRLVLYSSAGSRADGRKKSRTCILATSKRIHQEASYLLYSSASFKIFPLQDFVPVPVIQELRPMYRSMVTNLEIVLGPSWNSPPETWRVSKLLARRLRMLSALKTLRIFVELDPTIPELERYRISYDFYTNFCGNLIRDVLATMPHLKLIELDGNPGIDTAGPLVTRLLIEGEVKNITCALGPTKELTTPMGSKTVFWQ